MKKTKAELPTETIQATKNLTEATKKLSETLEKIVKERGLVKKPNGTYLG